MKHKLLIAVTALSLAIPSSLAFAEEGQSREGLMRLPARVVEQVKDKIQLQTGFRASSTDRKVEVKAALETRKASSTDRRGEFEARKASSTEKRIEVQENIAKRLSAHAAKMFTATVERLEKLIARLESRITKVKAEGGVAAISEGFIAEAKSHLSLAKAEIATFSSIDLSEDKLRENVSTLRAAGAEVKEHLKAAHQALVKAIRALKPGRSTNNGNATSTATSTPSTGSGQAATTTSNN